jgi:uncharacterized membrane protein YkoI
MHKKPFFIQNNWEFTLGGSLEMKKAALSVTTFALFTFGFVSASQLAQASQFAAGTEMTSQKVTEEKAKKIALKAVKGQSKTVMHVHLETDDGRQYYEILVRSDKRFYEVEIDAMTGKVLEVEKESGHDNYGQNED